MPLEGPPSEPLDQDFVAPEQEKVPMADEQCVEAMKAGNFEVVREWYAEQEKIADQDPSPQGRLNLTLKLAKLQLDAGIIDDDTGENYAFATLDAALQDAYHRGDDMTAGRVRAIIEQMRGE